MSAKLLYIISLIYLLSTGTSVKAQDIKLKYQDTEKIRGYRFSPYPNYTGSPFLNSQFLLGEIEFLDGTKIGNIGLNYGTYRDELIYYNQDISTQIVIDKISLKGFSFTDKKGVHRVFNRQYYSGSFQGDCFFEVLSSGKISLLAYRKVDLETCDTYQSKSGMAYQPAYVYYFYSKEKGYSPVNLNRNSFLSKFYKPDQKLVKKMLRKNGIFISDETTLVDAWNLVKESSLQINF
jgi:hypothetical protein